MSGEHLDEILQYAGKKSSFCDVRYMDVISTGAAYRNGSFEGAQSSVSKGYAIRLVNKSISMAYVNSEDMGKIRNSIDRAAKSSMFPGKSIIDESSEGTRKWSACGTKKVENVSLEDKISILKDSDSIMQSLGAGVRMNVISDKMVREVYVNSSGSQIEGEFSRIYYNYFAGILESGEFEQSTGEFGTTGGYEFIDGLKLEERVTADIDAIRKAIHAQRINPGKMDVVAGPEISGIVAHESCGHPTEYDRIVGREGALAGESFLTGKKMPFRVGSDCVNVVDDPSLDGSFGYYAYDDEGIPSRRRYLYRDGYTSEFIHNRESAARLGVKPNGGGRAASWDVEPLPRMSTTYIEPGDYDFEELVSEIKSGIYMKSFTEWNIDDIRFNEKYVGKEAYLIQNGKITEQIRRPIIETNTISFYSAIDAVGSDLEFSAAMCGKGDPEQGVDVWMGGPHIRLRDLYIQ